MVDTGQRRARPLAVEYAERVPLQERLGRYDEAQGLWMVQNGVGEVPLVRARSVALEETVTKIQADPTDPPRPRRGAAAIAARAPHARTELPILGETKTSVKADPSDPPRPRREMQRWVPEETLTFVGDEGTDEPHPAGAGADPRSH